MHWILEVMVVNNIGCIFILFIYSSRVAPGKSKDAECAIKASVRENGKWIVTYSSSSVKQPQ